MINLDKINGMHTGTEHTPTRPARPHTPTLSLPGHRWGLAANRLSALHSALVILAMRGHIGCAMDDGTVLPADHWGCDHHA